MPTYLLQDTTSMRRKYSKAGSGGIAISFHRTAYAVHGRLCRTRLRQGDVPAQPLPSPNACRTTTVYHVRDRRFQHTDAGTRSSRPSRRRRLNKAVKCLSALRRTGLYTCADAISCLSGLAKVDEHYRRGRWYCSTAGVVHAGSTVARSSCGMCL